MNALIEKDLDQPLIQMIRTYLINDDQLAVESYDHQLVRLSKVFRKKFDKYLNEEGTNDAQARELALNEVKKKILKTSVPNTTSSTV